jgi:hypothetical protein
LFSSQAYFKTIFAGGNDLVSEIAELKRQEAENFTKRVVVDNIEFKVNTIVKHTNDLDKFKGLLENPP